MEIDIKNLTAKVKRESGLSKSSLEELLPEAVKCDECWKFLVHRCQFLKGRSCASTTAAIHSNDRRQHKRERYS